MNKSPVYTKHDTPDDFDPQLLKEAKSALGGSRKPKNSWKSSVFSCLKGGKMRIAEEEAAAAFLYSKCKRNGGYVCGRINGMKGCHAGKLRRSLSGLFNLTKRVEDEVEIPPYISLNPQSYGPLYLVT